MKHLYTCDNSILPEVWNCIHYPTFRFIRKADKLTNNCKQGKTKEKHLKSCFQVSKYWEYFGENCMACLKLYFGVKVFVSRAFEHVLININERQINVEFKYDLLFSIK